MQGCPGTHAPDRTGARCGLARCCTHGRAVRARTCRTIGSSPGSTRGHGPRGRAARHQTARGTCRRHNPAPPAAGRTAAGSAHRGLSGTSGWTSCETPVTRGAVACAGMPCDSPCSQPSCTVAHGPACAHKWSSFAASTGRTALASLRQNRSPTGPAPRLPLRRASRSRRKPARRCTAIRSVLGSSCVRTTGPSFAGHSPLVARVMCPIHLKPSRRLPRCCPTRLSRLPTKGAALSADLLLVVDHQLHGGLLADVDSSRGLLAQRLERPVYTRKVHGSIP